MVNGERAAAQEKSTQALDEAVKVSFVPFRSSQIAFHAGRHRFQVIAEFVILGIAPA